jgi:hypothetical protein
MKLMGRAHMAVMWESKGVVVGMRKVEGNIPLANTLRLLGSNRLSGPARAGLGRMGWNLRRVLFWIKIGFLNIPRLWNFAQGDLGGMSHEDFS